MKKTSLLLVAALLFAMLAAFSVTAVTAEDERQPLKVTLLSGKTYLDGGELPSDKANLGQYFYGWTPIFNPSNTSTRVTPFMKANQTVEVIGQLEQPSAISTVVFNNVYKALRLNGVSVSFSVDGVNWVKGFTVQESGEFGGLAHEDIGGLVGIGIGGGGDHLIHGHVGIVQCRRRGVIKRQPGRGSRDSHSKVPFFR